MHAQDESPDYDALVSTMLAAARLSCTDEVSAVNHVMTQLEAIAQSDRPHALNLMLSLRPIADDLYMHDVYDAVGLWLADAGWEWGRNQKDTASRFIGG